MISKISNILKSNKDILDSIIKLATGSLLAQVIMILASPVSTRIFTPSELGVYTLVLTAVSMFGPVLSLRYDIAIVVGENKKETHALVKLSLLISCIMTAIIGCGYIYYLNNNIEIKQGVGGFVYLIIPILFITGLTNILMSYNNKNKEYGLMGTVQVVRALAQNIIMIILGLFNLGSVGLLLSQFIGNCFGVRRQSKAILKEIKEIIYTDFAVVKSVLIKYRKQVYFSTPAIFVNAASYSFINFAISDLFGMNTFGYYSLSYRMLGVPLSLVVMNVSKVFFQQAVQDKQDKGNYRSIFLKVIMLLIPVSIAMAIGIYLLGPTIFEIVFGEGWGIAGEYAKILVPMFSIRLIASTLTPSFTISNKQNIELLLQSAFMLFLGVSYFLVQFYGLKIEAFLSLINIFYSLIYILFILYTYKISGEVNGEVN